MKKLVIQSSMNLIRENFPDCDEERLEGIQYGLEGIYLSVTKLIVIFLIAWFIGVFKEACIILLLFNILRTTAFGIHATKSWMCWVSSSIVFLGGPLFFKYCSLPFPVLIASAIFCNICFLLYAPADTYKRPIVKKKKRMIFKFVTCFFGILYLVLILIIKNSFLQNAIGYALFIQMILIHPMVYKLFGLPYNNYKSYVFSK